MPAKDKYHDWVRVALEKDGWIITHDPLYLKVGRVEAYIDLGAEKLIGAEKEGEKIAVEIKTFGGASFVTEFYAAVGQFLTYNQMLHLEQPERKLYLAAPLEVYVGQIEDERIILDTLQNNHISLILFATDQPKIKRWIK